MRFFRLTAVLLLVIMCFSCVRGNFTGTTGGDTQSGSAQQQKDGEKRLTIGFSIATATFIIERWNKDLKVFTGAAQQLGADVIVGVRYESSSIMQNAAEVLAYGTAVKYQ